MNQYFSNIFHCAPTMVSGQHAGTDAAVSPYNTPARTAATVAATATRNTCALAAPAPELFPASKSSGALPQLMRTLSCSYTGFVLCRISVRVVFVLKLGVSLLLVNTLGLPPGVLTVRVLLAASQVAPCGGLALSCSSNNSSSSSNRVAQEQHR